jgi:hypothetical protein
MKTSHAINFPTDTSSPHDFFAQSQTMNINSPQADPKPSVAAASIALVPTLPFQVQATTAESNNSSKMMCPEKNINAFALFLVLEKQRNLKLRQLYRQRFDASSVDESSQSTQNQKHQEHYGVSLPTFPPRYQNLEVSPDWLMIKLRKQRPTSQALNEYKALDNVTKTFLEDTVRVLQDQCVEDAIINNLCSTSCNMRSMNRSSITITPPSSPLRLPRATLTLTEEEPPSISLSKSPSDSIHEVDLSDEQIMSLYEISESSGDALTLTEEEPPSISLSKSPSDSIHEVDLSDEQIMSLYEISESSGDAVVLNSRLI